MSNYGYTKTHTIYNYYCNQTNIFISNLNNYWSLINEYFSNLEQIKKTFNTLD
jgi:hypothetical protein